MTISCRLLAGTANAFVTMAGSKSARVKPHPLLGSFKETLLLLLESFLAWVLSTVMSTEV
jgi:hypothetical protein